MIGVLQSPEDVRDNILSGIGSTDGTMDMMQLVSLLLIPMLREEQEVREQLLEASAKGDSTDLLEFVVEMMLHDVTGSRQPKPLTKTLIKQIFQAYGETALSGDDELATEMMKQAGAGNGKRVLLDAKTFCRALTSDVQAFDVESKDKLSTNYNDVMKPQDQNDLELSTETASTAEGAWIMNQIATIPRIRLCRTIVTAQLWKTTRPLMTILRSRQYSPLRTLITLPIPFDPARSSSFNGPFSSFHFRPILFEFSMMRYLATLSADTIKEPRGYRTLGRSSVRLVSMC